MSSELTSTRSSRVNAIRRLGKRAFRAADRRFLAEGPQAVLEAVLCVPERVREVLVTADFEARHADIVSAARAAAVDVTRVSEGVLAEVTQTVTPQGVVAVCDFLDVGLAEVATAAPSLVAVLANVRDPGNAGTVLRAADAAGADAVLLSSASVDVYNGKCVRAAAGSLFHLPVVSGVDLPTATRALRAAGLRIVAADGSGRSLDAAADAGDLAPRTAWLFGNEAWGLPPDLLALADDVLAVPLYGRAESLNLATAAAVCLYASARAQRR